MPALIYGARYRVLPGARASESYYDAPPAGAVVTLDSYEPDYEGDVRVDCGDRTVHVLPEYLEPIGEHSLPPIGSASLRVDVRFFVGDRDVTDLVKGLVS